MKINLITCCFITIANLIFGQDPTQLYLDGVKKANNCKFEEAIQLFSQTIELQPENYYAWYNRGIAKGKLSQDESAQIDFVQTIKLAPDYKKGWLNLGTTKKHLTDYEGALSDYSYAIKLDPNYADAYYNRGLVYEKLSKNDSACIDFNKAREIGMKSSQKKVDKCNDTTKSTITIHSILRLTKTSSNSKYGFSSENPIMVGTGPDGGPSNQRAYLDLLRDQQGNPIKYERLGSCCDYKSENGLFGMAFLDEYEITYQNKEMKNKKTKVYISFYDFEKPQIISGFKTVSQK